MPGQIISGRVLPPRADAANKPDARPLVLYGDREKTARRNLERCIVTYKEYEYDAKKNTTIDY